MIRLLKNKEVRKALLWQLLFSAAACAVCFFFDIRAGLTAAGLCPHTRFAGQKNNLYNGKG